MFGKSKIGAAMPAAKSKRTATTATHNALRRAGGMSPRCKRPGCYYAIIEPTVKMVWVVGGKGTCVSGLFSWDRKAEGFEL